MAHLYPSLHDKFKSEGLCPICLVEMAYAPRFTCNNNHVICHRCRPYYYSCPQCLQPLRELPAEGDPRVYEPPYPHASMPHPAHMTPYPASAPQLHDFHEHERQPRGSWGPPSPPREDQELLDCPFAHLGCTAKFVPQLRHMHVTRCQYQHHGDEGEHDPERRIPCRYADIGCNVRAPYYNLRKHESLCIYKDRRPCEPVEELSDHFQEGCRFDDHDGDQNRMVDCPYRDRGCTVRMPLWRRETHESKCNYSSYEPPRHHQHSHGEEMYHHQEHYDPEELTDCRWAEFGCRVRPKRERKHIHEDKCNYRMEECAYRSRGCCEMLHPSRRYAHEKSCGYAY